VAVEIFGEERIEAPIEQVWIALNDPEVLKKCVPGCEELERDGEDGFSAVVKLTIGPVSARFSGKVTLSDLVPPHSYKITGEGRGGIAGFAKGGADVKLVAESNRVTVLTYNASADVGGKIAQLGGRLIQSTSKKLAGAFFSAFNRNVSN
jgi:carbon monoxide dehydrogenase subunit G